MKILVSFNSGVKSLVALLEALENPNEVHLFYIEGLFPSDTKEQKQCVQEMSRELLDYYGNHLWKQDPVTKLYQWNLTIHQIPSDVTFPTDADRKVYLAYQLHLESQRLKCDEVVIGDSSSTPEDLYELWTHCEEKTLGKRYSLVFPFWDHVYPRVNVEECEEQMSIF
jgi:hypothetical protein